MFEKICRLVIYLSLIVVLVTLGMFAVASDIKQHPNVGSGSGDDFNYYFLLF